MAVATRWAMAMTWRQSHQSDLSRQRHTVTRGYDALNRLHTVTDWLGKQTTLSYDNNSNLTSVVYPTSNNVGAAYSYDNANGIQSIVDETNATATPTPFSTYTYTLDGNQQVKSATDPIQGNGLHSYVRNTLNQLTSDAQSGGTGATTIGWGYDSAYRLTTRSNSVAGTSGAYMADNADELTALQTKTGSTVSQNLSFTYNKDGDRLTQADSVSGSSLGYNYDQADRLTKLISGTTTLATYGYDGDGLRQSTIISGTTAAYTWDQSGSLPLLLLAGTTSYIDGPDGHPIEQIDGSGNVSYYLYDQLGNLRGLVNTSGSVTNSYAYDAYGTRTAATGSTSATPFGFAGEYSDAETGFEYLQARYYDPNSGEFLTPDPLQDITGQPYAYAGDDPLSATDAAGLCPQNVGPFTVTAPGGSNAPGAGTCIQQLEKASLTLLLQFDNSDLSNTVNEDVNGLVTSAMDAANASQYCVQHPTECRNAAIAMADYIKNHPTDVATAIVQSGIAEAATYACEIQNHEYGAVAGNLLFDFVTLKGGELVTGLFRDAEAEAAADEAIIKQEESDLPQGSPCGHCFPAGTLVATPKGEQAIETLKVGDQVLSEDPKTGKVDAETVQAVWTDPVLPMAQVDLSDGTTIKATADHPFYVDAGGQYTTPQWVAAGQLVAGDRLRTASGHDVTVLAVVPYVGSAVVYTLTVANDHDFFVSADRVLVHNANCIGLTVAEAESAVTIGTGIQHGFRHVGSALGLGNWNKVSGAALSKIAKDVLTNPEAVVQNWTQAKGGQLIDIYIKRVNGLPLAIYVDKASGRVTTAVIAGAGQLANWGVSL